MHVDRLGDVAHLTIRVAPGGALGDSHGPTWVKQPTVEVTGNRRAAWVTIPLATDMSGDVSYEVKVKRGRVVSTAAPRDQYSQGSTFIKFRGKKSSMRVTVTAVDEWGNRSVWRHTIRR